MRKGPDLFRIFSEYMREYGIIGFPLSHSFSPAYFNGKFAAEHIEAHYSAFPITAITELPALLKQHAGLCGFNVTIPYKTAVLPYLDVISPDAAVIGAVNCVHIKDNLLYGYNTDHYGFCESLKPLLPDTPVSALVLGTGGASRAVCYTLRTLSIPYLTVSRKAAGPDVIDYDLLNPELIRQHQLIINTTPLGMSPHTDQCPDIPYASLHKDHILYDLVYNPGQTLFLKRGAAQHARTKNGADMLYLQAEENWRIWNSA